MLLGLTYILITVEIYYCRFQMLDDTSDRKAKQMSITTGLSATLIDIRTSISLERLNLETSNLMACKELGQRGRDLVYVT